MAQKDKKLEEKAIRSLRMVKLKDADDIESFLLAFERQMLTQGPAKNKWVTHLVPLLSGKALKAYTDLSETAAKGNGTVKETTLKYFNISVTTYHNRFKAARMEENESAQEFSTRLTEKWSSACRNIDDIRQLILVDKFVLDLPPLVRSWLWNKKPQTSATAELYDDYVARGREEAPFNKSFSRHSQPKSHECLSSGDRANRTSEDRRDSSNEKSDKSGPGKDKQSSNNPRQLPKFDPDKGPRCFNYN